MCRMFAAHGLVCASVNYRLSGKHRPQSFNLAEEDVAHALQWLDAQV